MLARLSQYLRNWLPTTGFHFDRPLVLLQSDDWGRVGLRDREGFDQLSAAGMNVGEHPYDFYTMETAEDLAAISVLLKRHRDSKGRHPCVEMNFVVANLDFAKLPGSDGHLPFLPLAEGLPEGWKRPGLIEAYKGGICDGVFYPALHGITHVCRNAVERSRADVERGKLLRTLWQAGTPYIYWRMPWVGYEYWDPEQPDGDRFLTRETQQKLIGDSVGAFAKLFSTLPHSACAPGYRANDDTHRAWSQHGVRVAQNGPGKVLPPYIGRHGVLQLTRTIDFEPAVDPAFSIDCCLQQAEHCFERGIPAIVSLHSINFHSTVRDFRSRTLEMLDQFFAGLESKHSDLIYLHDEDLRELVNTGAYGSPDGNVSLKVIQKKFIPAAAGQRRA
ncbi:MAG: hypothetical protein WAM79_08725 [Candidatus Sulfotelmatobacter sp.]